MSMEDDDTAGRLRELEIKVTFLENHVEAQDRVMLEQGRLLDRLTRELQRLRDTALSAKDDALPADEKPPHY